MTILDYLVLGFLFFSILLGLHRGLVKEVLSLSAWLLAFFVARHGAEAISLLLQTWVTQTALRYVLAFVLLFVLTLLCVALLARFLRQALALVGLGLLDRILGACFAGVRGSVIVSLCVLFLGMTSLPQQEWWRRSCTMVFFEASVMFLLPWLPPLVAKQIHYSR
jgi:membrane protein required for colicin V production